MGGFSHPAVRSGRVAAYLFVAAKARQEGRAWVRSDELADAIGLFDASAVRRDLAQVLATTPLPSRRAVGYQVGPLLEALAPLVGADAGSGGAALIGALANRRSSLDLAPGLDPRLRAGMEAALAIDAEIHEVAAAHAGVTP